ncbi:hypothetical protein BTVI_92309 [Pitangus sulphuratus]|nr:hypothetical protein BTVI_92309 [Pitangus sulphuratus]
MNLKEVVAPRREELTLDQSVPEGLYLMERTHTGDAHEKLQLVERTHIEEGPGRVSGVVEECEEEGAAETRCDELTIVPISCPPTSLCGRRQRNWEVEEAGLFLFLVILL